MKRKSMAERELERQVKNIECDMQNLATQIVSLKAEWEGMRKSKDMLESRLASMERARQ